MKPKEIEERYPLRKDLGEWVNYFSKQLTHIAACKTTFDDPVEKAYMRGINLLMERTDFGMHYVAQRALGDYQIWKSYLKERYDNPELKQIR